MLFSFAGVRALGPDEDKDPGRVSREAQVFDDAPGLISILGGKYTTYRAVAERVTDRIQRELGQRKTACMTALETLPGGESPAMDDYFSMAERILTTRYPGLEVEQLRYLVQTYGSRHTDVLREFGDNPEELQPIEPGPALHRSRGAVRRTPRNGADGRGCRPAPVLPPHSLAPCP